MLVLLEGAEIFSWAWRHLCDRGDPQMIYSLQLLIALEMRTNLSLNEVWMSTAAKVRAGKINIYSRAFYAQDSYHIWWCRQWNAKFGTSQQMARFHLDLFNFRLCPFAYGDELLVVWYFWSKMSRFSKCLTDILLNQKQEILRTKKLELKGLTVTAIGHKCSVTACIEEIA